MATVHTTTNYNSTTNDTNNTTSHDIEQLDNDNDEEDTLQIQQWLYRRLSRQYPEYAQPVPDNIPTNELVKLYKQYIDIIVSKQQKQQSSS